LKPVDKKRTRCRRGGDERGDRKRTEAEARRTAPKRPRGGKIKLLLEKAVKKKKKKAKTWPSPAGRRSDPVADHNLGASARSKETKKISTGETVLLPKTF